MNNNDLINLRQLFFIIAALIIIIVMLYRFNAKTKRIMAEFGVILAVFWSDIKNRFWE